MSTLHRWFQHKPVEKWDKPDQEADHRRERKRLSEHHYGRSQALSAWLLATLVGINGGALASKFIDATEAPCFVLGIIFAILAGFASWQEAQDRSGLHYVESLPLENVTFHGERLAQTWQWRWPALRLASKALNWLSLLSFVLGCIVAA